MINYRFIIHLLGRLLLIEGFFLFICLLVSFLYDGQAANAFLYTIGITTTIGLITSKCIKFDDKSLAKKDGYFIVTIVWLVFSLFGALPYIFSGSIPSFVDAFFETISGFTTTGASCPI